MFRDVAKGLVKNSSIMMSQQVITWGSTFLVMMILPRYLGPVEWGWIFLALSINQIFGTLVSYGGSYSVAKQVARLPSVAGQVMVDSIAFRFLLAILSIVAIVGYTFATGYSADLRLLIFIYALSLTWQSGSVVLYACYQGHEVMQYTSIAAIVERVLQVIVVVATVHAGANVFVIAILTTLCNFAGFVVLLIFSRRIIPAIPRVQWQSVGKEIRAGLPYFMFALLSTIYYRIDSLMLSKMTPEPVVGWYGASYRFFESLNFPYIITVALYPILSRLWKTENEVHARTMVKSLELMILAAIPITVGITAYAGKIVSLFYGLQSYEPSVILLQLLTGGLIFLYINMIVGTTLLASDRQNGLMVLALVLIPVNVLLNYFMIPYFQQHYNNGAIGAAIATGVTELLITIVGLNMLPNGLLSGFRLSILPKGVVAGITMAAVIWLLGATTLSWTICLIIGSFAYVVTLILMKVLEPADQAFLKEVLMTRLVKGLKRIAK